MTKSKPLGSLFNFLVPGLGQLYAQKTRKAIIVYVLFFVVVLSLRFVAYNFPLFVASLAAIVGYWLYLIISGYRDVETRQYDPTRLDQWYVYAVILFFHWAVAFTISGRMIDKVTPINFARIPTPAMDPTLQIGDVLAFEKTNSLARNDVTLFWFPNDIKTLYIKRCVGLPGDSLQIKATTVFANGKPLPKIPLKFRYLVTTNGTRINERFLEKQGLHESDYMSFAPDAYNFFLTDEQAQDFRTATFLKQVEPSVFTDGEPESMIYPEGGLHQWNTDFYGPVYIPKRGDKIQLNDTNIDLYQKCIAFENESVERGESGLYINRQLVNTYEFKDNYFFMMGDNRHNSLDSRYWGFLPEKLVVGKAMYLYWSETTERIGKKIL